MAAGLGFKTFVSGEVLTAADTNGYLMQGVLVFASSSARSAAVTSPQEGQYSFLKDTDVLEFYNGTAWVGAPVGDITSVGVTSPITGGGSSGAVTIAIQDATTSVKGAVQLSDSTSTTSSILAATPTAVKSAYDLATTANTTAGNVGMIQQYTATESVLKNISSRIPAGEQLLKQAVYWIDAAQSDNSDQVLDNQGWGGTAMTTQLGSSASADSNDPKFLDFDGTNYVYLPGATSSPLVQNGMSTPNTTNLSIAGDITIISQIAADSWATSNQTIVTKGISYPNPNYAFGVSASKIFFYFNDGTTWNSRQSTANVPFSAGAVGWIKVTGDVDNGASGNDFKFYTSTDGITWTQLGTTVTNAGVVALATNSNPLYFGHNGSFDEPFIGKIYQTQILSGIDGSPVFDLDTSVIGSASATSFSALTGNTITINRNTTGKKTTVVTHPVWLFGTDDYMEVADNALLDFAATDSFTLFVVQRQWNTFGTNDAILGKKADTTAATAGYLLGDDGTTAALARMQSGDGTNGTSAVTGSSRTSGTFNTIAAVRNVSTDNTIVYLNGVAGTAVTDTTTATLANAEVMRLGRLSGAGTEYNDMELVAAAIFRRVLTADEITTLYNYYTSRVGA